MIPFPWVRTQCGTEDRLGKIDLNPHAHRADSTPAVINPFPNNSLFVGSILLIG